jgi:hypothetical protein
MLDDDDLSAECTSPIEIMPLLCNWKQKKEAASLR